MAILLFALLAFESAVQALISILPPQTRTIVVNGSEPSPIAQVLAQLLSNHGLDKKATQKSTLCGNQETHCAELGHPELCCPPDTKCRRSSHTPSTIFCCPHTWFCNSNTPAQCPIHHFQCPASLNGACCPIGLRCASDSCLANQYKTLAVFEPLVVQDFTGPPVPVNRVLVLPTPNIAAQNSLPLPKSVVGAAAPTCAWPDCQPGVPGKRPIDLPISDRILSTPTAWSAKIGEVAVSQTDETNDSKETQKRLIRLACVWGAVTLISVLMVVL